MEAEKSGGRLKSSVLQPPPELNSAGSSSVIGGSNPLQQPQICRSADLRICGSADRAWPPLTLVYFISAEQGKVLKVLHTSEGVFTISQYSLFHNEGPVLNMAIDSEKVSNPDPDPDLDPHPEPDPPSVSRRFPNSAHVCL